MFAPVSPPALFTSPSPRSPRTPTAMSVELDEEAKKKLQQRRSSNVRRVSGVDLSVHHYVPFIPKRKSSMSSGCRITANSEVFADYKHIFPYIMDDGKMTLLTEYDFHNKMSRKYKALFGDTYIYPILGANLTVQEDMLCELTREDKTILELLVLPEVEIMIPGGISTVRTNNKRVGLFIIGKSGDIFPASLRVIKNREIQQLEERFANCGMMKNFAVPEIGESTTSNHVVEQFVQGMDKPDVRRIRDVVGIVESQEEFIAKMEAYGIFHTYVEQLDLATYYENVRNRKTRFVDAGDWREYKDDEPFDWSDWDALSKRRGTETSEDSGIAHDDGPGSPNSVVICDMPKCNSVSGCKGPQQDDEMPPLVSAKDDDDVFMSHNGAGCD